MITLDRLVRDVERSFWEGRINRDDGPRRPVYRAGSVIGGYKLGDAVRSGLSLEEIKDKLAERRASQKQKPKPEIEPKVRENKPLPIVFADFLKPVADLVKSFPHATEEIVHTTAMDWHFGGPEDAERRGITKEEWLWKRSRWLAGFR